MDLENALPTPEIRRIDDDLPVESSGAQQCRVEDVRTVGRRDENDAVVRLEPVHLDEQLIERLLTLVVPAAQSGATVTADGVDFVDEDDARRVRLALLEQVAHPRRANAHEHLDEIRAGHREERAASLAGNRARKERLARARWADEQRTLR